MNHLESEPAEIIVSSSSFFFILSVFDHINGILLVSEMEPNQCLLSSQMFTDLKITSYIKYNPPSALSNKRAEKGEKQGFLEWEK